jgi:hypothetical protein
VLGQRLRQFAVVVAAAVGAETGAAAEIHRGRG